MAERISNSDPHRVETPADGDRTTGELAQAIERLRSLIEERLAPAIERVALAIEGGSVSGAGATHPAPGSGRCSGEAAAIVRAIDDDQWGLAEGAFDRYAQRYPDDPELAALRERLEAARGRTIVELRTRLEASRKVNDPETVIALHDNLAPLLQGEARRELSQEIVRWLILLIQRRMRSGTVQADVVDLATKVADRFSSTTEGASVRASLPTLRRSAGLCSRCGVPYAGLEDACPRCLSTVAAQSGDIETPRNPWADQTEEDIPEVQRTEDYLDPGD